MREAYRKYGFTVICCVVAFTTSACSNVSSSKEGKSSYVINEIIASQEPSQQPKTEEEVATTLMEDAISKGIIGFTEQEVTDNEVLILSDASSVSENIVEFNSYPALGSVYEPNSIEIVDNEALKLINSMPVKSIIKMYTTNAATFAQCFTSQEISPTIFNRMENKSFSEGCTTELSNLRYIRVLHYGFDGEIHIGELIVNRLIESDILEIFKELFDAKYPIEQMVLIDEYDADDELSMEANNTSSFNFRMVAGTTKLSKHAYGLAIDINPLYNPYIRTVNGEQLISPDNATEYVDRTLDCKYYIQKDDVIYKIFSKHGFTWGGDWTSSLDYQHFQKVFQ
jgi:hypothetical protein